VNELGSYRENALENFAVLLTVLAFEIRDIPCILKQRKSSSEGPTLSKAKASKDVVVPYATKSIVSGHDTCALL